jgi:hypothetical protein
VGNEFLNIFIGLYRAALHEQKNYKTIVTLANLLSTAETTTGTEEILKKGLSLEDKTKHPNRNLDITFNHTSHIRHTPHSCYHPHTHSLTFTNTTYTHTILTHTLKRAFTPTHTHPHTDKHHSKNHFFRFRGNQNG